MSPSACSRTYATHMHIICKSAYAVTLHRIKRDHNVKLWYWLNYLRLHIFRIDQINPTGRCQPNKLFILGCQTLYLENANWHTNEWDSICPIFPIFPILSKISEICPIILLGVLYFLFFFYLSLWWIYFSYTSRNKNIQFLFSKKHMSEMNIRSNELIQLAVEHLRRRLMER